MKKTLVLLLALILLALTLSGCTQKKGEEDPFKLDTSKQVTLTIWGSMTDFPAIEPIILAFEKTYPRCTIIYKLLDDFDKNILAKLESETDTASMFLGYRETFRTTPALGEYALDFSNFKDVGVDISQLNPVLTASAICDDGGQYVIPLGLESRGLAVNTSLLKEHGLDVPKNLDEFTAACDKLVAAGLVPIQTYHDECVMQLMYAYIANTIVHGENYPTVFASMNAKEAGTSQYLKSAFDMLDSFTRRGYISYAENVKVTAAHYNVEGSYQAAVMNFLEGDVAFCPTTASCFCSIAARETLSPQFTSKPFEYQFIAAPLAKDGSYGYLQPWMGICINKKSDNVNWSRAFVNFLCKKENMAAVAENKGFIPNCKESVTDHRFDSILSLDDKHITNLSMFTNTFYSPLRNTLQRLGHPFEYAGEKGAFEPEDGQTYYTATGTVYTAVTALEDVADGTPLFCECYKKRALVKVGDEAFTPSDATVYYTLTQGAYRPLADVSEAKTGESIYIDDYKQVGTKGDKAFVADENARYYVLTGSGFDQVADIQAVEDGVKLFVEEARTPYRMNGHTAPAYYEGQIGH